MPIIDIILIGKVNVRECIAVALVFCTVVTGDNAETFIRQQADSQFLYHGFPSYPLTIALVKHAVNQRGIPLVRVNVIPINVSGGYA